MSFIEQFAGGEYPSARERRTIEGIRVEVGWKPPPSLPLRVQAGESVAVVLHFPDRPIQVCVCTGEAGWVAGALAILTPFVGAISALEYAQAFAEDMLSAIPPEGFAYTGVEVYHWLADQGIVASPALDWGDGWEPPRDRIAREEANVFRALEQRDEYARRVNPEGSIPDPR